MFECLDTGPSDPSWPFPERPEVSLCDMDRSLESQLLWSRQGLCWVVLHELDTKPKVIGEEGISIKKMPS